MFAFSHRLLLWALLCVVSVCGTVLLLFPAYTPLPTLWGEWDFLPSVMFDYVEVGCPL